MQIQGFAEQGGFQPSGISPNKVQRSFPAATITVYNAGTTTLASIYSNSAYSSAKANPFVADDKGFYVFHAKPGTYDIVFSDGGIATPFTLGGINAIDSTQVSKWIVFSSSLSGIHQDSDIDTGGGTDDTSILQAFLNTAQTSNVGIVLIFDGICLHTGLIVYGNTRICGKPKSGLYLKTGSNHSSIRNGNRTSGTIIDKNIIIEDIELNHNTNGQHKYEDAGSPPVAIMNAGLQFMGVENLKVRRVKSKDSRGFNMHLANLAGNCIIEENHVLLSFVEFENHDGIHVNSPQKDNLIIQNNIFEGLTDDAVAISPDDDQSIIGGNAFLAFGDMENVLVKDNTFKNCIYGVRCLSTVHRLNRLVVDGLYGTIQEHRFKVDDYSYILGASYVGNYGILEYRNDNVKYAFVSLRDYAQRGAIQIGANVDVFITDKLKQSDGYYPDYRPYLFVQEYNASDTGHGRVRLLVTEMEIMDLAGLVIGSDPNRGNRLQVKGVVDVADVTVHHNRDASVAAATGAVWVNSSTSTNGIGTLILRGVGNGLANVISLTSGKIANIIFDGYTDINDAGALIFAQAFAAIGQYPIVSGRAVTIGTGGLVGGADAANVRFNGMVYNNSLILKASDGTNNYKITVNNAGVVSAALI